ncbi:helix-turn-helix domain-containing protein [Catenulispora subtropica]|uniref:HTH araC/xylS-type domain-containing protein n=1 Tax=Catenulispora subtropica TaxID=450798 RepID=A0ABP5BTS9_9ACTN
MTTPQIAWHGGVRVVTDESGPAVTVRSARDIAADGDRHMAARLQTGGEVSLLQDGRSVRVPAGSLVLYDTGRPFKIVMPERQRAHILAVPRALLRQEESVLRSITPMVIAPETADDGEGTTAGLTALATAMLEELIVAEPPVREHLARAVADVVGSLVAEHVGSRRRAAEPRELLWRRVTGFVEQNLGDPELSPQRIADRHHISVRYLQVLFQQQGTTVNGWVRERRLEAASRDLVRSGAHRRSVAAIAARWGFTNPSHFSRAFREAFGASPMQWRDGAHSRARIGDSQCGEGKVGPTAAA